MEYRGSTRSHFAPQAKHRDKGWESVAQWYDGMVGDAGSRIHQSIALSWVLKQLALKKGETILDIGCGQGVLSSSVSACGANYIGIDNSRTMIAQAQRRHGKEGTFIVGDITHPVSARGLSRNAFDACLFLLSIQDIRSAHQAISTAASLLKPGGRMVIFMTHPAFRVPRQSGWGYDQRRKLVYRRVDSYLSPLDVPMRAHFTTGKTLTRSYHRPLSYYINALAEAGIAILYTEEIPINDEATTSADKSEKRAHREIPLFFALVGKKLSGKQ